MSRVRLDLERCFTGEENVADTPRPLSRSQKDALLHKAGGYVKASMEPAY